MWITVSFHGVLSRIFREYQRDRMCNKGMMDCMSLHETYWELCTLSRRQTVSIQGQPLGADRAIVASPNICVK